MSPELTDELVKENIDEFRRRYARYSDQVKNLVERTKGAYAFSLNPPTQIVRIGLKEPRLECLIVLHKTTVPDLRVLTLENVTLEGLSPALLQRLAPEVIELAEARKLSPSIKRKIGSVRRELGDEVEEALFYAASLSDGLAFFLFNPTLAEDRHALARGLDLNMKDELRDSLIEKKEIIINQTLRELIRDAGQVQASESRTKILETTEKLQSQIEEMYKQQKELGEDVFGLRRIVGGKTFGEWKALISEIDKVNTRIDAFSEIKSGYDRVLSQQNEFMKQQSEVMKQQASFVTWIKYATILVPIAVLLTPIINALVQHFL